MESNFIFLKHRFLAGFIVFLSYPPVCGQCLKEHNATHKWDFKKLAWILEEAAIGKIKKKTHKTFLGSSNSLKRTDIYIQWLLKAQVSFENVQSLGTDYAILYDDKASVRLVSLMTDADSSEAGRPRGKQARWAEHGLSQNNLIFPISQSHKYFSSFGFYLSKTCILI